LLFKSVFTALFWALCLFAFYDGQLPSWTHLQFRQVNCFDETGAFPSFPSIRRIVGTDKGMDIVLAVWLTPVRRTEASSALSLFLVISYVRPSPSHFSSFP
jgi:hypothetical protein